MITADAVLLKNETISRHFLETKWKQQNPSADTTGKYFSAFTCRIRRQMSYFPGRDI
jgi:hypothetical protein